MDLTSKYEHYQDWNVPVLLFNLKALGYELDIYSFTV